MNLTPASCTRPVEAPGPGSLMEKGLPFPAGPSSLQVPGPAAAQPRTQVPPPPPASFPACPLGQGERPDRGALVAAPFRSLDPLTSCSPPRICSQLSCGPRQPLLGPAVPKIKAPEAHLQGGWDRSSPAPGRGTGPPALVSPSRSQKHLARGCVAGAARAEAGGLLDPLPRAGRGDREHPRERWGGHGQRERLLTCQHLGRPRGGGAGATLGTGSGGEAGREGGGSGCRCGGGGESARGYPVSCPPSFSPS